MTTMRRDIFFIVLLFGFLNIRDVFPEVDVDRSLLESVIRTKMNNEEACHSNYDHCTDGTVTGDYGDLWPPDDHSELLRTFLIQRLLSRCFCDEAQCRTFGDCCPDVVLADIKKVVAAISTDAVDDVQEANRVQSARYHDFECQGFTLNHDCSAQHFSVYMITSCAQAWRDNRVDDLCHRRASSYDYILDLPVISQDTNVTYRNVYCAICNEDIDALEPSAIVITCPSVYDNCLDDWSQWQYVAGEQRWRHMNNTEDGHPTNKYFQVIFPLRDIDWIYGESKMRSCVKDLVSTCPSHWKGELERRLCSAYALIVSDGPTGTRYKNRHCAICNGVAAVNKSMSCPKLSEYRIWSDLSYPDLWSVNNRYLLVNFTNGDSSEHSCGHGEIFDVIRRRCHRYTCGPYFWLDDVTGRCHRKRTDVLLDCLQVALYEDEFVFLSNGNIYVNKTDSIYGMDSYEVINDTTVRMCAPHSFVDRLNTAVVSVSLACLGVHILVHVYVPQLCDIPGKNLLSLSTALFLVQFLFGHGLIGINDHPVPCIILAVIAQVCILARTFWMNVIAFDASRTFSGGDQSHLPSRNGHTFLKYSIYAWLTPSAIVGLALINELTEFLPGDLRPNYVGLKFCFINNLRARLVFIDAPVAVLTIGSTALFAVTAFRIWNDKHAASGSRRDHHMKLKRIQFRLHSILHLIMSLASVSILAASHLQVVLFWYIFIVLNALQGVFIFFAFTFKWKVLQMVRHRFKGMMPMQWVQPTTDHGRQD